MPAHLFSPPSFDRRKLPTIAAKYSAICCSTSPWTRIHWSRTWTCRRPPCSGARSSSRTRRSTTTTITITTTRSRRRWERRQPTTSWWRPTQVSASAPRTTWRMRNAAWVMLSPCFSFLLFLALALAPYVTESEEHMARAASCFYLPLPLAGGSLWKMQMSFAHAAAAWGLLGKKFISWGKAGWEYQIRRIWGKG